MCYNGSYFFYRKETVMTLANGEQIIKDWEYATQKGSTGKLNKSLIVTNKRIVHEMHSHIARSHQEIPLNSVKSISMSSVRKTPIGAILAIIFGIIVAAAGLYLGLFSGEGASVSTMLPILLVGILFIVIGVLGLGHGAFTLEITTSGLEGSSLYIGTSNIVTKRRKKEKKVKIKIDLKVVDDIMDTLGAILLDNVK